MDELARKVQSFSREGLGFPEEVFVWWDELARVSRIAGLRGKGLGSGR
jgi:hypothetical protein